MGRVNPLRQARKAAGLSMKEAAEASHTPYRTWQGWEDGSRRVPGIALAWIELYKLHLQPCPLNLTPKPVSTANIP